MDPAAGDQPGELDPELVPAVPRRARAIGVVVAAGQPAGDHRQGDVLVARPDCHWYPIPFGTEVDGFEAHGMTMSPDGRIWFCDATTNKIGIVAA